VGSTRVKAAQKYFDEIGVNDASSCSLSNYYLLSLLADCIFGKYPIKLKLDLLECGLFV
jgi:hypothetical protein